METDLDAIGAELDGIHAAGRRAYLTRDLEGYRALFTDDLRYVQPNGKPIGVARLMRDVAKQLSRFKTVDSESERESLTVNDDGTVTVVALQKASYSVSVFFFFTKTWKIERRGKYTYRRTRTGWRIADVEVLSETVR